MLSERGLQIIERLIDNNRKPITSKKLAMYLGVSERSVKTYIKEVSDFCTENSMELIRKPGIGFVANFTDDQIEKVNDLKRDKKIVMSKKQRMSYIVYILLSGWDTYTLSLFSDELNVSKKVISDDINTISRQLNKYNININRVAGHGVFISGNEFSIRKAMRSYCVAPIGNKEVKETMDCRISSHEEELCINNFGKDNFHKAIDVIHEIEEIYHVEYTDYSFKMLAEYLCIQLFRVRMGNVIKEDIIKDDTILSNEKIVNKVADRFDELHKSTMTDKEKQYIDILFASATIQDVNLEYQLLYKEKYAKKFDMLIKEMLDYLSEILNSNISDNHLLTTSLDTFLPASIIRTTYGIEVYNPFLKDIREMYSGVLATSYTLSKFYEEYCGNTPTDQEISFLALFIGGALHRNYKTIKAVLIGTTGNAAANIVAERIEKNIGDIKIERVLTVSQVNKIKDYEHDIVLCMTNVPIEDKRVVYISPIINKNDEEKIRDACYDVLANPIMEKEDFSHLIESDFISIINVKMSKEFILKDACKKLIKEGYVKKEFFSDVIRRENIESTAIGSGVAIPHGMAENVINPKIFVIKLGCPIAWENEIVDMIFLLALNFNNIGTTKAFFSDFSKILSVEDKINNIRKAENPEELEKVLKKELHWR